MPEVLEIPERLKWWTDATFGMFIHWGVYAIPARGEWVMHQERIPTDEYRPLCDEFDPQNYHPDHWVAMAQDAGMKYMVLTSRHHDGYCLFDSKVSDFTAPKTAAKRDLLGEYVEACNKANMRCGFYFSLLDWRYPAYWDGPDKDPDAWEEYVDYVHGQVRELCTNYGTLDVLWYDGGWPHDAKAWRSEKLNAMVRELQPGIIINNRAQTPEDFDTPEQHITASDGPRLWESCMTMNDHWGYSQGDINYKTATTLIQNVVACAVGGGNYLLNIGPKPDGSFPGESVARLHELGRWMDVYGESVYGTDPSKISGGIIGRTTVKGNMLYFHVFTWTGTTACLPALATPVKAACLLGTGAKVSVDQRGDGRVFLGDLPATAPDPHVSVIALECDGRPAWEGETRWE